jgi:hypothetical protein
MLNPYRILLLDEEKAVLSSGTNPAAKEERVLKDH